MELECDHFATSKELMHLGNDHQWLLTLKKDSQPDILSPKRKNTPPLKSTLAKKFEPKSHRVSVLTSNV